MNGTPSLEELGPSVRPEVCPRASQRRKREHRHEREGASKTRKSKPMTVRRKVKGGWQLTYVATILTAKNQPIFKALRRRPGFPILARESRDAP